MFGNHPSVCLPVATNRQYPVLNLPMSYFVLGSSSLTLNVLICLEDKSAVFCVQLLPINFFCSHRMKNTNPIERGNRYINGYHTNKLIDQRIKIMKRVEVSAKRSKNFTASYSQRHLKSPILLEFEHCIHDTQRNQQTTLTSSRQMAVH